MSRRGPVGGPDLGELLARSRFEILPLARVEREVLHLPPGTTVTVTCSPHRGIEPTLEVAERLTELGFRAVPHLSARFVAGAGHLEDILGRLANAGIRDVFVVAGDVGRPAGPYASAGELLSALAGMDHGLEEIGIAAYPEGHPLIDDRTLMRALQDKQRFATYLTTQICFHPATLFDWIVRVRRRGIHLPIYIGLPGLVSRRKLLEVSLRVGVGDSVRYLVKHGGLASRLLRHGAYRPDAFLAEASALVRDPDHRLRGFHIFTFNQVRSTEGWRRQTLPRHVKEASA